LGKSLDGQTNGSANEWQTAKGRFGAIHTDNQQLIEIYDLLLAVRRSGWQCSSCDRIILPGKTNGLTGFRCMIQKFSKNKGSIGARLTMECRGTAGSRTPIGDVLAGKAAMLPQDDRKNDTSRAGGFCPFHGIVLFFPSSMQTVPTIFE
jgi:hypothetical protein